MSSDHWPDLFGTEGFCAAIFDCDGTLVESSAAHLQAMQSAAQDQGADMRADWYHTRAGLDRGALFREFAPTLQTPFNVDQACEASIVKFADAVSMVKPNTSVLQFAMALKAQGIPLAVGTNAEGCVVRRCLAAVAAKDLFNHIVSISDAVRPKPSPDIFELAAKRLGIGPSQVLVFEDSPQGVRAAKDAGMSVIELVEGAGNNQRCSPMSAAG
ncbi:HAD family phosphatase [uncultured Tateyamaria sp.]|uniref:HAD family hydrolase n=1 Tax=uncultured Tateyamaria sp. TaxID=455651 RepID=UPI00262C3A6C|nr:HAD family phosphatase [uncultured Tateyamaria sp.]